MSTYHWALNDLESEIVRLLMLPALLNTTLREV